MVCKKGKIIPIARGYLCAITEKTVLLTCFKPLCWSSVFHTVDEVDRCDCRRESTVELVRGTTHVEKFTEVV